MTANYFNTPMNPTSTSNESNRRHQLGEILRFGIVGTIATAIQYVVYLLLKGLLMAELANVVAYVVSFLFNFVASVKFTFRTNATARKGAGFLFSHLVNLTLQTVLLHLFIKVGVSETIAPIPMFCICVPVNFLLVRYFLTGKDKKNHQKEL